MLKCYETHISNNNKNILWKNMLLPFVPSHYISVPPLCQNSQKSFLWWKFFLHGFAKTLKKVFLWRKVFCQNSRKKFFVTEGFLHSSFCQCTRLPPHWWPCDEMRKQLSFQISLFPFLGFLPPSYLCGYSTRHPTTIPSVCVCVRHKNLGNINLVGPCKSQLCISDQNTWDYHFWHPWTTSCSKI